MLIPLLIWLLPITAPEVSQDAIVDHPPMDRSVLWE